MTRFHWFILLVLVAFWTILAGIIAWGATGSWASVIFWMAIVGSGSLVILILCFSLAINGNSVFDH